MHWLREAIETSSEARRILDDPDAAFGANVRRYRLQAGWTQRTLTEVLLQETGVKIDASAVTRIEQGRAVSLKHALALSYALDAMGLDVMLDEVDTVTREEMLQQLQDDVAAMQENLEGYLQRARMTEQLMQTRREQIVELEAELEARREGTEPEGGD